MGFTIMFTLIKEKVNNNLTNHCLVSKASSSALGTAKMSVQVSSYSRPNSKTIPVTENVFTHHSLVWKIHKQTNGHHRMSGTERPNFVDGFNCLTPREA